MGTDNSGEAVVRFGILKLFEMEVSLFLKENHHKYYQYEERI